MLHFASSQVQFLPFHLQHHIQRYQHLQWCLPPNLHHQLCICGKAIMSVNIMLLITHGMHLLTCRWWHCDQLRWVIHAWMSLHQEIHWSVSWSWFGGGTQDWNREKKFTVKVHTELDEAITWGAQKKLIRNEIFKSAVNTFWSKWGIQVDIDHSCVDPLLWTVKYSQLYTVIGVTLNLKW